MEINQLNINFKQHQIKQVRRMVPKALYKGPIYKETAEDIQIEKEISLLVLEADKIRQLMLSSTSQKMRYYYNDLLTHIDNKIEKLEYDLRQSKILRHQKQLNQKK